MEAILPFILGSLSALTGVMIGAYAVFKTKRGSYEPFFGGPGKGESFNIEEDYETQEMPSKTALPKATEKANDSFVEQFAETLAEKAGK